MGYLGFRHCILFCLFMYNITNTDHSLIEQAIPKHNSPHQHPTKYPHPLIFLTLPQNIPLHPHPTLHLIIKKTIIQ